MALSSVPEMLQGNRNNSKTVGQYFTTTTCSVLFKKKIKNNSKNSMKEKGKIFQEQNTIIWSVFSQDVGRKQQKVLAAEKLGN